MKKHARFQFLIVTILLSFLSLAASASVFSVAPSYPLETSPFDVVTGDFNGDGFQDIATAAGGSGELYVLLGTGNGKFAAAVNYPTTHPAAALAIGDMNGDGKLDIVASEGFSGANAFVEVLLGDGAGAFTSASVSRGGLNSAGIALADLNGDHKLDVLCGNQTGVAVFLGNGNGTVQPFLLTNAARAVLALAMADMNGDGKMDMVALLSFGGQPVAVYLGNGDGTFQPPASFDADLELMLAVADLNADGKPDVVLTGFDNYAEILLGNGDGTLRPRVSYGTTAAYANALAIGDFTGDGKPDIAVAEGYGGPGSFNNVTLMVGRGDGTFTFSPDSYGTGLSPYSIAAADLNNDGRLDLVTANVWGNSVSVLLGTGHGFQANVDYNGGSGSITGALADFNNDGKLDALQASVTSLTVQFGNGDGTFSPMHIATRSPLYLGAVAVGDFNHDGKMDVAAIISPPQGVSQVGIFFGKGDGKFLPPVPYSPGIQPLASLAAVDLNHDGNLDLALGGTGATIMLGNADGTFQPALTYAASGGSGSLAPGDFNGDGKVDLVALGYPHDWIFIGNGDGTFQPPAGISSALGSSLTASDFNHDGKLDVAIAGTDQSESHDYVYVLMGNGDGTFQPAVRYQVGGYIGLVAADLNGDGNPDLAVLDDNKFLANVVLGRGDGTFSNKQSYAIGGTPYKLLPADLNGDGINDMVAVGTSTLSIFLGKGN